MIAPGAGIRVYLACGRTDMRRGLDGLAMLVQQAFSEDPFSGAVFAFRGHKAGQIKLLWHDGIASCMLNRRLERGTFFLAEKRHDPGITFPGTVSDSSGRLRVARTCAKLSSGIGWVSLQRR